jgi:hypothetical protein
MSYALVSFAGVLLPNTDRDEILPWHRQPRRRAIFLVHRDEVPFKGG